MIHYIKLFLGSALVGFILFLGIILLRWANKVKTEGIWLYFIFWVLVLPFICVLIFYLQEGK
jgi:hypothetical protein